MKKVKIFFSENWQELEKAINDFIKNKFVIDIKYTSVFIPKKFIGAAIAESAVIDRVIIYYQE